MDLPAKGDRVWYSEPKGAWRGGQRSCLVLAVGVKWTRLFDIGRAAIFRVQTQDLLKWGRLGGVVEPHVTIRYLEELATHSKPRQRGAIAHAIAALAAPADR